MENVDAVIEWLKDKDIIKMSYQENNAREDMKKYVPTIIEDLSTVTQKETVLDKIRAEIENQEKWLTSAGYNAYNVDIAFNSIKKVLKEVRDEE